MFKTIFKKMTAGFLALMMISSVCCAETAETSEISETPEQVAAVEETAAETVETKAAFEYDYKITNLLSALGIIDKIDKSTAEEVLNAPFTRAEFAVTLLKFTNRENLATGGGSTFKDVVKGTYEEPFISAAVDMGLIAPVADGYFYPGYAMGYAEAAQALVMTLGYSPAAQQKDNWLAKAQEIGILKGVKSETELTRGTAYKMLYNALRCDVMDISGVKADSTSYTVYKGKKAIYVFFDILYEEGIITAAGGIELGGDSDFGSKYIKINGKEMYLGMHNLKNYIGRNVIVYYNDDNDVVCVEDKGNNIETLDAEDIEKYENLTYTYGEKDKKIKLKKPYVILNGEEYIGVYTSDVMIPQTGDVTLIDNNNDGDYEIVIIESYKDYYVEYVTTDPASVVDNYGNIVSADEDIYDTEVYAMSGAELEVSSITPGMVVTVAQSNKNVIFRVSEEKVDGKLTGYSDGDDFTWEINGESYKVSPALKEGLANGGIKTPDSLKNCTFRLNVFGEVVYWEEIVKQVGAERFYAIVTGASIDDMDEELEMKLFSKEFGGFEVVKCADNVKLNGKKATKNEVYNALRRNGLNGDTLAADKTGIWAQPVKVQLNDNDELVYISQASTKDDGTEADFSYFMGSTSKKTQIKAYREILQYGWAKDDPEYENISFEEAPYISCDGNRRWKHIGTGRSHLTVIQAPFDENGVMVGSSEDLYATRSLPGEETTMLVYRIDDALEADFVIVCVEDIESEHCKNTYNIRCVKEIKNEYVKEQAVQAIYTDKGTFYNTENYDLDNLVLYDLGGNPQKDENGNIKTHKVKPGDLVNILEDATNSIVAIEAVYDHENNKLLGDATVKNGTQALYCHISDYEWWQRNEAGTSNEGGNLILCDILKREGSYFVGCLAEAETYVPSEDQLFISLTPPNCVKVNINEKGKVTITSPTANDYVAYEYAPGKQSHIVMGMGWTTFNGTSFIYEHN